MVTDFGQPGLGWAWHRPNERITIKITMLMSVKKRFIYDLLLVGFINYEFLPFYYYLVNRNLK